MKKLRFELRLRTDLLERLRAHSTSSGESMTFITERALTHFLDCGHAQDMRQRASATDSGGDRN